MDVEISNISSPTDKSHVEFESATATAIATANVTATANANMVATVTAAAAVAGTDDPSLIGEADPYYLRGHRS